MLYVVVIHPLVILFCYALYTVVTQILLRVLYGYQSTRHTVKSSHGHLITRLTHHRSTRHIRFSSRSQLVTSEHTTKPSAAGEIVPRNSA